MDLAYKSGALGLGFTSQLNNLFFLGLDIYILKTLWVSLQLKCLKEVVGKMLLDFCVRVCYHASSCKEEFQASNQFLFKHCNYMPKSEIYDI